MTLSEVLLVTDCDGTLLQDDKSIAPEDQTPSNGSGQREDLSP